MRCFSFTLLSVGVLCLAGTAFISCMGTTPTKEVHLVDSLSRVTYTCHHKNLSSSYHTASKAYQEIGLYSQGKAETCNNLDFCVFMRVDLEEAEKCCQIVYNLTENELELPVVDIGLMKIYQRTALNREFYDCWNSVLRRMRRIAEGNNPFADRHERMRLAYARSEFYIVSAICYYYLQQRPEVSASIGEVTENEELVKDTNQSSYYHYIKVSTSLCGGEILNERRLKEFSEPYTTRRLASQRGYLYSEDNGVQGLANLMASSDNYGFFQGRHSYALKQFGEPVGFLLPMQLGQLVLKKFRQYDDIYQIVSAHVSIGKYLNAYGKYKQTLDTLVCALGCVNDHHCHFYDRHDSLDWLRAYDRRNTIYMEKVWLQQRLKAVPEWVPRMRGQLSVTYAGLETKGYSDYNRNICLDILGDIRQDKELGSRYQVLEEEAAQLNLLLLLVIMGFILVLIFFWFSSKRSKVRNKLHLHRLQSMSNTCQGITVSILADIQTEGDITDATLTTIRPGPKKLFGTEDIYVKNRKMAFVQRTGKNEQAMTQATNPYVQWALDNGMTSVSLGEEQRRLRKQRYIYERHIAGNERQNLIKKARLSTVNGTRPYISHILNKVHKLMHLGYIHDKVIKNMKYQYIDGLVTTISEYNGILALWVKMKQGTLSLNIETSKLDELFGLLKEGNRAFEMRQLDSVVSPTDVYVKADKALAFFMINTLAENACRCTPKGGTVEICARKENDYVEISVGDNGHDLFPEDVAHTTREKIYNSRTIGMNDAPSREELRKKGGSGFRLINCKGIIEKYKKTNPTFSACLFDMESALGKGSRFYFRLPVGVCKVIAAVLFVLSLSMVPCSRTANNDTSREVPADSLVSIFQEEYEFLLDQASDYANGAYYCNVEGEYAMALQYMDSATMRPNEHYGKHAEKLHCCMTLTDNNMPAELDWQSKMFNSDFHAILDLRNEATVAFLALKQWDNCSYNNGVYTTLYKLLGEDQSLEYFCHELERSANNKMVSILPVAIPLVALCLGCYILYFHR